MKTGSTQRRLDKLAARIRPNGRREFTLEELCRYWWRLDKRGFLAYMKKEYPALHVFAGMFEREDAERAALARRAAR
jgi:hypothetical protein